MNRVPISEPGGGGGTEHEITPSRDPAAVCKHSFAIGRQEDVMRATFYRINEYNERYPPSPLSQPARSKLWCN